MNDKKGPTLDEVKNRVSAMQEAEDMEGERFDICHGCMQKEVFPLIRKTYAIAPRRIKQWA